MRILIAEDDLDISTLYKKALEKRNHVVDLTSSGDTCIQKYVDNLPPTETSPKSTSGIATSDIGWSPFHSKIDSSSIQTMKAASTFYVKPSYDVVILDYKLPGMNGMDVAKEILEINPHQRIIFASAYVEETLQESVLQLNQVVELMQKPFKLSRLVDTVEDKEVYEELKKLNVDIDRVRGAELSHETLSVLLEKLVRVQKISTF
jgi:CheY-like chemotaxis protein